MAGFDYQGLIDAVASYAMQTGEFENPVPTHEPKSRPGFGMTCSVFVAGIEPVGEASGLNSVSGLVLMTARVQTPFLQHPADQIDGNVLRAGGAVMALFAGGFTLGGIVRNVDIFGAHGQKMRGQLGYVTQDSTIYRINDVTIPLVVNDLWGESP
jgi:hypothetical protein